jgi:hypothetical protein
VFRAMRATVSWMKIMSSGSGVFFIQNDTSCSKKVEDRSMIRGHRLAKHQAA